MIEVEWNQLVVGDRVVVHQQRTGEPMVLLRGSVQAVTPGRPANDVGVRVDGSSDEPLYWPSRLEVHAATDHGRALCPWCSRIGRGNPPASPSSWVTR